MSRFFGNITIDGKVQGIFRSLDYKYDEDTGEVVKELKDKEGEVTGPGYPQSVKIRSTKKLYTVDTQKWLLIQDDILSGKIKSKVNYKRPNEKETVDPLAWRFSPKGDDITDESYQYGVCNENEGFIRNVYFHGMYLANKMLEADTMESAIMSVWNEFATAYGGVHQFKIEFEDDGNHIVIRDTGQQGDAVINLIENGKNNRRNQDTGEEGDMNGLFEFPIWENGSIVKSQNLNAKLPSRMQMAAMYGSQNADTSENESQRTNDVLAGLAWGKLFSPDGEDDDEKTLEAMKKKKYKDMFSGDIDFPSKHNRSFGRADANPMTNLHVGDGDGTLKTPEGGTIVYPSIFDEIFAGQAQELQKRIKESLEGEDVADERSWYQKMFGDSETAATEKKMSEAKKKWMNNFTTSGNSSLDMYMYHPQKVGSSGRFSDSKGWGTIKIKPEFSAVMKSYFRGDVEGIANKTDPIIPVELEIDVDGTGGIFPGNAFQSSYLPQRYRDLCCFQVVGASHKLDSTGWTTTIKGQIRVGMREKIAKAEVVPPVITTGADIKAGVDAANNSVDLRDAKEKIPRSTGKDGTTTISGTDSNKLQRDNTESGDLHIPLEKVEYTPEELENLARDRTMLQYDENNVNQYDAMKANLIKKINGEDSQWDTDNLLNLSNLIDNREKDGSSNTGLSFLQYMNDNHEDRSVFPQYLTWNDDKEINLAYEMWRDAGVNSTPTGD